MTIYYANPVGRQGSDVHNLVLSEMRDGSRIRYIDTPDQWNTRPVTVRWCADNGCFSAKRSIEGIPWDQDGWWNWLVENAPYAHLCDFANAPDVVNMVPTVEDPDPANPEHWAPVGDAAATLERSRPWLAKIRALGYPVGYVAQDGFDPTVIPWDDIDVLFIGGSDDFKIGPHRLRMDGTPKGEVPALQAIKEAQARGKKVHIGRVNSRMRFRFAARYGVDSVDGTYATYDPSKNVSKILSWVTEGQQAPVTSDRAQVAAAAAGWEARETITEGFSGRYALPNTDTYVRAGQSVVATYSDTGRLLHVTHFDGDRYESDITTDFAIARLRPEVPEAPQGIKVRLGAPFLAELHDGPADVRAKAAAAPSYKDGSIVVELSDVEAQALRAFTAHRTSRSSRAVFRAVA